MVDKGEVWGRVKTAIGLDDSENGVNLGFKCAGSWFVGLGFRV